MNSQKKHLPVVLCVGALWLALAFLCWFLPAKNESQSERRLLQQLPEINMENILSGSFSSDFDKYTLDQFPARDSFRRIKAQSTFYFYLQKDNNDIYINDGFAAKLEYPLNEELVGGAAEKFTEIYNKYLMDSGNVFMSVIPDKGYFLAEQNGYPSMDYEKLFSIVKNGTEWAEYIDITDLLSLEDYYKTDTHWKQDKITDVAQTIAAAMGIPAYDGGYTEHDAGVDFYGVYYGQSALPLPGERITYLTSEATDGISVYNLEKDRWGEIYDMDKAQSRDPYEIFLSGASPVLVMENPEADGGELVVFRDSFGSSLVPLLGYGYSKITLVDTRYIATAALGDFVSFEGADVLFIYSTLILNQSTVLK